MMVPKCSWFLAAPIALAACAATPVTSVGGPVLVPAIERVAAAMPVASPTVAAAPEGIPEDWVVPEALATLRRPPRKGSFAATVAMLASERQVAPIAIDLASLPTFDVAPRPKMGKAPKEPPAVEVAEEVHTFQHRLTVRGRRFGAVSVGWLSRPFFAFADGGIGPTRSHGIVNVAWISFSVLPDGHAEVEEMEGLYDIDTKKAYALWRSKATAAPLVEGLAYAYRSVCSKCPGSPERLHIITPSTDWESTSAGEAVGARSWGAPFSTTELALEPGKGGALTGRFTPHAIETWRKSGARPPHAKPTRFGLELSRGASESGAVALLYVGQFTM